MKQVNKWVLAAILMFCGFTTQAQETGIMRWASTVCGHSQPKCWSTTSATSPDESATKTEEYRQEILKKMSRADLIRCILLHPTVKLSMTQSNTGYEAQYIQNPLMNL